MFAQILTFWYFVHLLVVLPLLGFFETPRKLPATITDAVLAATHHGSSGAMVAARTTASPSVNG